MTEEKILAFLNLSREQKIDKSMMKIALWFDVSFTFFITIFGFVLCLIPFSQINIVLIPSFITIDVLFLIWLKLLKNPAYQFVFTPIVLLCSTIKLIYGYTIFSNGEFVKYGYPMFGWAHFVMLIVALAVAVYVSTKFYNIYVTLKTNTIERTHKKIKKKIPKWILPISLIPPIVLIRLFKDSLRNIGVGIGFSLWTLACIWLLLSLMCLPKCIVSLRFKIFTLFKNRVGSN